MSDPKRVSPQEAKALIDEGWTYLDVRTPAEWAAGHPVGAPNVPWAFSGPAGMSPNPGFVKAVEAIFGKEAKLVLGCKSGNRSLKATLALLAAGFENVVDQRAGYEGPRDAFGKVSEPGWAPAGLPTETTTPGKSWSELEPKA
jgi:rhodanese-related sulfurtransferase